MSIFEEYGTFKLQGVTIISIQVNQTVLWQKMAQRSSDILAHNFTVSELKFLSKGHNFRRKLIFDSLVEEYIKVFRINTRKKLFIE